MRNADTFSRKSSGRKVDYHGESVGSCTDARATPGAPSINFPRAAQFA
jgi:hypothetical protein